MKQYRIVITLLLLLAGLLVACSPGHTGSNEIAFIRNGQLWTIDPDGSNAFAVVAGDTPVLSYGWSPTHQILFFRSLDSTLARTTAAKHLRTDPITDLPPDLPATLNTIGIDGGTPIPIMFSSSDIQYSNAWWDTTGDRLLYREGFYSSSTGANGVFWWISQNDQPGGIARKSVPSSYSIPSLASASRMAIGNTAQGIFTTSFTGTNQHYLTSNRLPGHPLPATLERILWQPSHQNPSLLYVVSAATQSGNTTAPPVQLVMRDSTGQLTTLATCLCTQFAWAPDGNHILFSTGTSYSILNVHDQSSFTFSAEAKSVPYWSPDSQYLLLDGMHTLLLVQLANQQQQVLLSDSTGLSNESENNNTVPGVYTLLQPVSNSPWAADSRHFLFQTQNRLLWRGKSLSNGLYTITIDSSGAIQGAPALVDSGNDVQAGWTYANPDTSFLY